MRHTKTTLLVIFVALLAWYFLGGGIKLHLRSEMTQMARDAAKEYQQARQEGNHIDAYAQAGLAAAAYLQMEDWTNHSKWKKRQEKEAAIVGIGNEKP